MVVGGRLGWEVTIEGSKGQARLWVRQNEGRKNAAKKKTKRGRIQRTHSTVTAYSAHSQGPKKTREFKEKSSKCKNSI